MIKTLPKSNTRIKRKIEPSSTRIYEPEEFEADTDEERPIAFLAEKRRQFLAGLQTREKEAGTLAAE